MDVISFEGLTLVFDTINCNGVPLLKCFARKLLNKYDSLQCVVADQPTSRFLQGMPDVELNNLPLLDWYSDPPANFAECETCLLNRPSSSSQQPLIFDSLSHLLLTRNGGVQKTCNLLWRISRIRCVIALVHEELLSELAVNQLCFIATANCRLNVSPDGQLQCRSTVRRGNGKLALKTEICAISPAFTVTVHEPKQQGLGQDMDKLSANQAKSSSNPLTGAVPFDMGLKLSKKEQQNKESINLPYTAAQNQQGLVGLNATSGSKKLRAGGQIIYTPDDADDLDDSDPDDDLMI